MSVLPILGVGAATYPTASPLTKSAPSGSGEAFADTLKQALESVDQSQHKADDKLAELATGQSPDLHGTMIALEEADITLRTMVSVRDKVVDAYQQIMNMNI